jgi:hypothetical protein
MTMGIPNIFVVKAVGSDYSTTERLDDHKEARLYAVMHSDTWQISTEETKDGDNEVIVMCCDKHKFNDLSNIYPRSREKIKALAIKKNKKLLEYRKNGKHIHEKF